MDKLKDIFDKVPNYTQIRFASCELHEDDTEGMRLPKKATLVIAFGKPGFGFGEFTFVQDSDGKLYLDTECSNRETVIECLAQLVNEAIVDWDQDPIKHKKYNEIRGRRCGELCKVCFPDMS